MGAVFVATREPGRGITILREGDAAPDFTLTSTAGRTVRLSDLRGKVVLVHFWATWCPPCVEEYPLVEQLAAVFAGADFEILAVSVDDQGADAVAPFLKRNRLTMPVLLNPDRSVANRYGTYKFPESYLIDRAGRVRHKVIGARDWTVPVNRRLIQDLLAER